MSTQHNEIQIHAIVLIYYSTWPTISTTCLMRSWKREPLVELAEPWQQVLLMEGEQPPQLLAPVLDLLWQAEALARELLLAPSDGTNCSLPQGATPATSSK